MSRVAVVGAGAMGGLWAALLDQAGEEVTVIDASPDTVAAISERGIAVVADGKDDVVARVAATASTTAAGPQDIVFVFVKGPHTASVAGDIGPLLGPATVVATLQNGWGNADVLAQAVPHERLVVGVTYHSATLVAPGRLTHPGAGPSRIGPYVEGGSLDPSHRVATAMEAAGLETTVHEVVRSEVWRKLIHNAACLPVAALTGLRAAPMVEAGPWRDTIDGLAREAVAVARALGHDIDPEERIAHIHRVLAGAGMTVPSMLADTMARRATEIDTVNGAVVRAAAEAGISVPLNEAMVALVKGLERSWVPAPDD